MPANHIRSSKNFYGGGIGSVRGFESSSLGPRDSDGDASGGNRKFNFSLELLTPIPGADRTLRMFTFLDGGWVWGRKAEYILAPVLIVLSDTRRIS